MKIILIGSLDFERQKLNKDTLNILAVINYRFWVKDEAHKKWLIDKYKKNEEVCKNIEVKELFCDTTDRKEEHITNNKGELVVIKEEKFFRKLLNFIKSKLYNRDKKY